MTKTFARFSIVALALAFVGITTSASAETSNGSSTIVVTYGTLTEWKSNHETKKPQQVELGKRNSPSKRERLTPQATHEPISLGN